MGLAVLVFLCAQYDLSAKQYSFKLYGPEEGLRNQNINCLLQDHRGFLWTGTQNGLFLYDGSRFTFFGQADGLPDETIQSLYESSGGTLWVGTRLGLAQFDGKRFVADPVLGKIELFGYSNIVSDARGSVYVGTSRGLAIRESPSLSQKSRFRFLTADAVHGVYIDPYGTLWFGAGSSLWHMDKGTPVAIEQNSGIQKDRWDSILVDGTGTLWIRSSEHLMFRRQGSQTFESVPGIPHSPEFGFIYKTQDGRVFVPTVRGLMAYSGNKWEAVGANQGLLANEVTCLLQDHEGSVWVGLGGQGLERWLGFNGWEGWKTADGLSSNIIWDLQRDASGHMLIATEDGLDIQDPRSGDWILKSGRGSSVRAVLDDPQHNAVWYGNNPGGVFRLDRRTGKIRHFGVREGLKNERIDKLFWDSDQSLWATTRAGLFRGKLQGEEVAFTQQEVPYTDANEGFFGYLLDHRGRLWIGGSRGLVVRDHGQWRRFSKSDGLIGEGVSHLAETPDGAIWLGYLTNSGISRLVLDKERVHFDHFTAQDGLTSNGTVFVGVDSRGWVWVGSDNGVDVYAGSKWKHYGKADGLIWDDCDTLAFLPEKDGSVWIGTSGGLSRFRPSNYSGLKAATRVYVTSIQAGSSSFDPDSPVSLLYQNRSLMFTFAAPTFVNESAVRFQYRMLGLEKDWTEAEGRWARYRTLPAGDYRFEVIARNGQGEWSQDAASVAISIQTPWWQTWTFRLFSGFLLLSLGHLLWKLRIRYLVQKQESLEKLLLKAQTADQLKSEAIDEIRKGEAREKNRSCVLELISSHQPIGSVLDSIINTVELDDPDTLCLILTLRDGHFQRGASRRLPLQFARSFEGLAIDCRETCFAAAASRTETIDVTDVRTSPIWASHRIRLLELGIVCSRSAPILSGSAHVLGTVTYFRKSSFSGLARNSDLLENAARLATVAMEHLSLYEQLSHRAQYDTLTELPNRLLFHERLEQALVRAKRNGTRLSVLWLDLDGFKHVNDTLGHQAGDTLLQTIAKRISACLRQDDTAARMGGDEFTVLIESQNRAAVSSIVQKLILAIGQPVQFESRDVFVTASVGVSVYPDDSGDAIQLVKNADLAMYHVKRLGKNAHNFFAPEMASAEASRIEIESNLRNALAKHEFELYYQPQYRLDRSLSGFEALLRWTNSKLGTVPPSRFIPVAEATGLIVNLGQWVLEEACRQSVVWIAAGYTDFRIAVNVSAHQFARTDFPESVAQLLKAMGISPERIELELTETAIMGDVGKSSAQLRELRELGLTVSIDDFGTGYSSLSYLQRLPVDAIKIDQSFVQALTDQPSSSLTMIQAIVNLAHDLNLRVVAEGVETEEQLACLQTVGCDLAQGYLLNRPMTVQDATNLLARHSLHLQSASEETLVYS